MSAPASVSICTVVSWPYSIACNKGVQPISSVLSMSTPAAIRAFIPHRDHFQRPWRLPSDQYDYARLYQHPSRSMLVPLADCRVGRLLKNGVNIIFIVSLISLNRNLLIKSKPELSSSPLHGRLYRHI